jgi:5-(aminomethyl)-3-furanmethanol phosphate kinase
MANAVVRANTGLAADAGEARCIVVKLGGSVVRSGELIAWLDAIAAASCPVVVVPGGGALADEVRSCQSELGFGDAAAHRMALLAMDQLAWAVAGLRPGFVVGATEADLRAALERGKVAVWAPYSEIAGRTDLEESWRLTSDSLALWLAAKIGAARCYLIKSIERKVTRATATELAETGVVDTAFPSMLKDLDVPTFLLGRDDRQAFAAALAGKTGPAGSFAATID